ncbi:MAG: hypothetical protein EA423_09675 [Phycisphaerales bacterium]|nr:MAG: hypothetical protein EA423_09675 [Phycisphaerales bacterium]
MLTICFALAAPLAGCTASAPATFDTDAPDGRIQAIVNAARADDRAAIRDLIDQLDSDDPAVRMLSIRTLERMTGETLGYRHSDPDHLRRAAVDRWVGWAEQGGHGS